MIACIACTCGSIDRLIRSRLEFCGYSDFLTVPIIRGKEKSNRALNSLPQTSGVDMVREHLKKCSKYAIVIGYNEDNCRWVDLANGKAAMNNVDLEMIVKHFA